MDLTGPVGRLFKELVWDAYVRAALEALYTAVPFLRVLSPVLNWVAFLLTDKLYALMDLGMDLSQIPFKNAVHRKAFDNAAVHLRVLEKHHGVESEAYLKARAEHEAKLSTFARIDLA